VVVGLVRGGGPVLAACVAGLLLSGPAVQAAPHAPEGLPGPRPGCPPQHGIAAPASEPWAQQALRFSAVWDRSRGSGVTVAIVDSGVDANPQFGGRVIPGPDLVAGTKPGIPPGADCVGHGTAVASIIAAAPVPGVSFTGVAPAARILSVKISGTDTFPTTVTPQGIVDAVQFGADVINLSLATPDDVPALRNAVEYALSHNVVVVAAAGNDLPQGGAGPFYPAAYPGVLAVGAVGSGGALAAFSDRHTPVAVTAPGVNVTSAYPGTFPDAYAPVQNGTSFAAAFVSGVVALVRSAHPGLSAAQVVARIEATARGAAGPGTGHGMVDPVRAVTAVLPAESGAGSGAGGTGGQGRPAQTARAAPSGVSAGTVALAVIAGSFGLMAVVVTAVLVIRRRRDTGPSGRHAR
jgi:type VII secretion-associated serine protease mycosin